MSDEILTLVDEIVEEAGLISCDYQKIDENRNKIASLLEERKENEKTN